MSWLDEILESTKKLESPKRYFLWSALSAVSAIVKDNVWVNRGNAYNLYPNIYVILYGPSGLRKGLPIALAKELVTKVGNTRVISGRASIEAILQSLGTAFTSPGRVINDSAGFIVASEFASSIVHNPAAITILTDLYDRIYNKGNWDNLLKSGSEKLKKPIVTLLGGANPAQFADVINNRDMEGGFLGRTFIISETKRNTINSLARPIENPPNADKLAEHLVALSTLRGEFHVTEEALDIFDEWYRDVFKDDPEDITGTMLRLGDIVFRTAMLLALSSGVELYIGKAIMEAAITLSEPLVPDAQKTTMGKGKSDMAEQTAVFIRALARAPEYTISRINLLKSNWRDFDALDCDRIVLTLTDSNVVKVWEGEKGKLYYTLTPEAVTSINEMNRRKTS